MIVVVKEEIDGWKIAKSLKEVKLRRALGFSQPRGRDQQIIFLPPRDCVL